MNKNQTKKELIAINSIKLDYTHHWLKTYIFRKISLINKQQIRE